MKVLSVTELVGSATNKDPFAGKISPIGLVGYVHACNNSRFHCMRTASRANEYNCKVVS